MRLSALIAEAGGTPIALQVRADVTLEADTVSDSQVTGVELTLDSALER
jgi:osmotically inducible protein OsmC